MKRAGLRQIVRYEGELMEVTGIAEGRTIIMDPVLDKGEPCPACGHRRSVHILEDSPLFQNGVEPVETLRED